MRVSFPVEKNYRYFKFDKNYILGKPADNMNKPYSIEYSIYDKGSHKISFGENLIQDYLYDKSLIKHIHEANDINPVYVEDYFNAMGIPCRFDRGSEKTRKVIAYCAFKTSEIFRQMNMVLPTQLGMESHEANSDGGINIAVCYYLPGAGIPIRTVNFNSLYDWDNHIERSKENNSNGFHSSGHFLQTFIHEYAHNVHYHHLYSKFGCPVANNLGYYYNPETMRILNALNMQVYDPKTGEPSKYNSYVTEDARKGMKQSSKYGSSLLPETFAEELARAVINCLDPISLQLTKNPFPIITASPNLNAVLYETWEGLVADGAGIIK